MCPSAKTDQELCNLFSRILAREIQIGINLVVISQVLLVLLCGRDSRAAQWHPAACSVGTYPRSLVTTAILVKTVGPYLATDLQLCEWLSYYHPRPLSIYWEYCLTWDVLVPPKSDVAADKNRKRQHYRIPVFDAGNRLSRVS